MRAPDFWHAAPGLRARLLSPLGALYASATAYRLRKPGYRASVPVVCIGNINAGGTGKTPTTMALLERLTSQGHTPHVVSRGYGGTLAGPVQVATQSAAQTGDEPQLLANFAPTWIAKDRAAGVQAAEAEGASIILLDDGFQNPSVVKDLSIIVVDAGTGFGNGHVLPAGPLREPIGIGLARAQLLLSIGGPADQTTFQNTWGSQLTLPHLTGHLAPLRTGMPWQDLNLMAFAGIGHPEKFFDTLRQLGTTVVHTQALDDHQPLSEALMTRLMSEAHKRKAQLVTTEKDAVRLPYRFRGEVLTLPVRLQIEDWSPLDALIAEKLR